MNKVDKTYFQALAERDYLAWCLKEMYKKVKARSGLDKAIDRATGYEAALTKEAKKMIRRIDKLTEMIGDRREPGD
jgi:hypothetical protein